MPYLLHTCFTFQKSNNSTDRLYHLRIFSRNNVAGNIKHSIPKVAIGRHSNVCTFGNGRRFRRSNWTWHSRNDITKTRRQSSGRIICRQYFPNHPDNFPRHLQNNERKKRTSTKFINLQKIINGENFPLLSADSLFGTRQGQTLLIGRAG